MNSENDRGVAPEQDGRASRWEAHREARRLDLLRIARKAIHRLGPNASMEDIAAEAGTSKSVFYRYFGDKSGLRRAVGSIVVEHMRSTVLEAGKTAATEEEGLHGMVAAYLAMAERSPNVYFFVTSLAHDPLAAEARGEEEDEEPLDTFFRDITTLMGESLAHYLDRTDRTAGSEQHTLLWPQASIGMVRAAGEAWLRMPASAEKPTHEELTDTITGWLVHGISGPSRKART
ncbi:TetR/AcrR family transcriptional regulator [Zhihengliuella halotolerans]|uniref:TetR family transcriptional regulator n=1 Tax=Zhihengliuella halotolerans TaxID=370736 RepID=A0A4Q8AAW3_9MICC|nr:TetR/AcrR family transcriptional regulator [Zhihengliuella halotolerans]RZU61267.1 TetR family transcriptional regulator [Zhihengliuella halotolerans]